MGVFTIAAVLILIIFSVILHELAHGYIALFLGDQTAKDAGRLTLNPVRHIDLIGTILVPIITILFLGIPLAWLKPVPFDPRNFYPAWQRLGEVVTTIGGPMMNICIAFIAGMFFRILPLPHVGESIVITTIYANVFIAFLNLIPVPPLDGSHIYTAFLPEKINREIRSLFPFTIFLALFVFSTLAPYLNAFAGYLTLLFAGLPSR